MIKSVGSITKTEKILLIYKSYEVKQQVQRAKKTTVTNSTNKKDN